MPQDEAAGLASRLFGKAFPKSPGGQTLKGIPDTRGLSASVLAQILIPLIKATEELPPELRNGRLTAEMDVIRKLSKPKPKATPKRTTTKPPPKQPPPRRRR